MSSTARVVVYYSSCGCCRCCSVVRLIFLLEPHDPTASCRHALQDSLVRLRTYLGGLFNFVTEFFRKRDFNVTRAKLIKKYSIRTGKTHFRATTVPTDPSVAPMLTTRPINRIVIGYWQNLRANSMLCPNMQ